MLLGLVALGWTGPATSADDGGSGERPGRGLSIAQVVRFDPSAGGFSFGGELASVKAQHQVTTARVDVRSVDPGTLGVALSGEGCNGEEPLWPREDQPQPLLVDSRHDAASEGRSDSENGFSRQARADSSPAASGSVELEPIGLPGAVVLRGGTSTARSGHLEGSAHEAAGSVSISTIDLAGGLVQLRGLEWSVRHRSDGETDASFDMAGVSIAGTPVPEAGAEELLAVVGEVLGTVGLSLDPPRVQQRGGTTFVEPLRIAVEPEPTRDQLGSALLTNVQPLRQAVVDLLLEADCASGSLLTVADLIVGSLTGAGSFTIELGGVQASAGEVQPATGLGVRGPVAGPTPADAPPPSTVTSAPPPPTRAPASPTTSSTALPDQVAAPVPEPIESVAADRGGRDLAGSVGVVVLLLGLALAEGDRRRMRRAQSRQVGRADGGGGLP